MRTIALAAACAVLGAAVLAQAPPAGAAGTYQIGGYAGKCADDSGNSAALRAKVQVWDCVGDAAQQWSFSGGELHHGSMCMNVKGGVKAGSPVILWRCDAAANEEWVYSTVGGKYFLPAAGLCLDDPAFSTRNGTQLIVWRCNGGANQQWSPPPDLLPSPSPSQPSPSPSPSPTPTPVGCHPLSNEGTCYEPGEFCRNSDHGVTGVAGDGKTIVCEDNDGWRWEPV